MFDPDRRRERAGEPERENAPSRGLDRGEVVEPELGLEIVVEAALTLALDRVRRTG